MTTLYRKPSLEDYILIEVNGEIGKFQLDAMDSILLPVSENGPIEELEAEIDDMKSFLTSLSSDFAATHETISEINEQYELKSDTDYMISNPEYLDQDRISEMIADKNILLKDDVDSEYDEVYDKVDDKIESVNDKVYNWY